MRKFRKFKLLNFPAANKDHMNRVVRFSGRGSDRFQHPNKTLFQHISVIMCKGTRMDSLAREVFLDAMV